MLSLHHVARLALVSLPLAALSAGCAESDEGPGPDTSTQGETVTDEEGGGGRANFCAAVRCGAGLVCDEATDACVPPSSLEDAPAAGDFCLQALCPPGTACNEDADACESSPDADLPPVENFCLLALCPAGTTCDEAADDCVPTSTTEEETPGDFCAEVLCPPGTVCNEATDACEAP